MKLESIERVTTLQNHRTRVLELRGAACGGPIDAHLWNLGEKIDVFSVISSEPIRAAIANECTVAVIEIETELKALGVYVKDPEPPLKGTLEGWRDAAHMYCSAWTRELAGYIPNKHHRIDALVIGTRDLVASKKDQPNER